MNKNININSEYMSYLLSLPKKEKVHVIHVLFQSMAEEKNKREPLSTEMFLDSVVLKKGDVVPPEVNGISSLISEKYMQ